MGSGAELSNHTLTVVTQIERKHFDVIKNHTIYIFGGHNT